MSPVNWQRTIDQIILTGLDKDDRVIGVTSIRRGSGVSLLCRSLARTLAANRLDVLLVNLSESPGSEETSQSDAEAPTFSETDGCPLGKIKADGQGYDLLLLPPRSAIERHLTDLAQLQQILSDEKLAKYNRIVLDLPPVLNEIPIGINSVGAGSMCDRLMLTTRIGQDKKSELIEVVSLLRDACVQTSSILANNFRPPRKLSRAG